MEVAAEAAEQRIAEEQVVVKAGGQEVLTVAIAERYLAGELGSLCSMYTSIEDAAAESLAKHEGILNLSGLTTLSDAASSHAIYQ